MQYTNTAVAASRSKTAKALLAAGIVAGPLFYAVIVAQIFTRTGFDIARHPVSLLSLGEAGWIQRANFITTGLLGLAAAFGFKRAMSRDVGTTWGPLLVGFFGAGTIVAGLFAPDPAFGFPPGSPSGMPTAMSVHSMLHGIGFDVAFLSLIVACFVFARRYSKLSQPKWRAYSITTGVFIPILIIAGIGLQTIMGILFFSAGMVAFSWLTAVAYNERTLC